MGVEQGVVDGVIESGMGSKGHAPVETHSDPSLTTQAESAAYPASDWVSAGIPGTPVITDVQGTDDEATISFTVAADDVADKARVYYADGTLSWTALPTLITIDRSQAVKTAVVAASSLPRSGNWRFKLEAGERAGSTIACSGQQALGVALEDSSNWLHGVA